MPSLFPGMDPYLEQPTFWSAFHSRLIVAIADALAPQLRPRYYIEVETRTYTDIDGELLVGIPDGVVLARTQAVPTEPRDGAVETVAVQPRPQQVTLPMPVEIKERYLTVREVGTDAVITVIEVLSPKNKRQGPGRAAYVTKRQAILSSASHLVELDLLRGDEPLPMAGAGPLAQYHVLVSRSDQRPQADLYGFTVQEPLPLFPLPLKGDDESLGVDLASIFAGVYERASYDLRIDYSQAPPPPIFTQADQAWINGLLQSDRS
ncbi:MAG: DUF4058 family protein [Leptolyngbya sp. RL_3_1]|nr:DUF4058 family protein [Leptolyngbya sp. RL_3_1]